MILTDEQMELASYVGKLRGDVQSAVAECAMAVWSGFPWRAVSDGIREPNVGPMWIKSCSAGGRLILPSNSFSMSPHVLLKVYGKEVIFQGWAFGFEVLKEKNWDTRIQAYVKEKLYEMRSLYNWCKSSGWNVNAVNYPLFATGCEPYVEFGSDW